MRNPSEVGGLHRERTAAHRGGLPGLSGDAQREEDHLSWRVVYPMLVCARCASLLEECRRREQRYALALGSGALRNPSARMPTQILDLAEEAKINLKLAEIEFLRHHDRHDSDPNGLRKNTPVNSGPRG